MIGHWGQFYEEFYKRSFQAGMVIFYVKASKLLKTSQHSAYSDKQLFTQVKFFTWLVPMAYPIINSRGGKLCRFGQAARLKQASLLRKAIG